MEKLTLLIDLDDTIFDFDKAETNSIIRAYMDFNIELKSEYIFGYKKINQKVWKEHEKGLISKADLGLIRFVRLKEKFNLDIDPVEIARVYRGYLATSGDLIRGARNFLINNYKKYDLYAITNGIYDAQQSRLRISDIGKYFKDIFISEQIGFAKPQKEYFDYVEEHIKNFDNESTYIIGDSLSSDIKGGVNSGIKTIWFNPKKRLNIENFTPTYEVLSYKQLQNLLLELN